MTLTIHSIGVLLYMNSNIIRKKRPSTLCVLGLLGIISLKNEVYGCLSAPGYDHHIKLDEQHLQYQ